MKIFSDNKNSSNNKPEEKIKNILSPIDNDELDKNAIDKKIKSIAKDKKLFSAFKQMREQTPSELLNSGKMKAYGSILKKAVDHRIDGEHFKKQNFADDGGTWKLIEDITKLNNISPDFNKYRSVFGQRKESSIGKGLSDKDYNKRIIFITNGEYAKYLILNLNAFSVKCEEQICKLQHYKHVGQEQNVDGYDVRGVPVQIKVYHQFTSPTKLGAESSLRKKYISEEWRYFFYNSNFKQINKKQINELSDEEKVYICLFPIFLTAKNLEFKPEEMTAKGNTTDFEKTHFKNLADMKFKRIVADYPDVIKQWERIIKFSNDFLNYGVIDSFKRLKAIYKKRQEEEIISKAEKEILETRKKLINRRLNSKGLSLVNNHEIKVNR